MRISSRSTFSEVQKRTVLATKTQCTNEKAKKDGYFIGRGGKPRVSDFKFRFEAKLEWDKYETLSSLNANKGECDDLSTRKDSQKCGIGKSLMELCLKDEDVTEDGGINPLTYNDDKSINYSIWEDEEFTNAAHKLCKTLIVITCLPVPPTTIYSCKAYIEAAKKQKYQMMFTDEYDDYGYHVLKTEDAETQFNLSPDNFIQSKGRYWFFCKCKRGSTADCLNLDEYPKEND